MKKIFLCMTLAVISGVSALAQGPNEISIYFGGPAGGIRFTDNYHYYFSGSTLKGLYEPTYSRGGAATFGLEYTRPVNDWLRVGADVCLGLVNVSRWSPVAYGSSTASEATQYLIAAMPEVKFSYHQGRKLLYYGKAAAGAMLSTSEFDKLECLFAYCLTPIGIQLGREKMFCYFDYAIGNTTMFKFGVGYRF